MSILHQSYRAKANPLSDSTVSFGIVPPPGALLWQTCLRQTIFVRPEDAKNWRESGMSSRVEFYEAEKAYAFLLQVLCGLKSDMIGETEVLGQFKSFLQSHSEHDLVRQDPTLWNSLLRDSKIVREKFLKNLGCHSYGSLARKLLRTVHGEVLILGAGQLAGQIVPWLKEHKSINVLARDPQKAKLALAGLPVRVLDNTESIPSDTVSAILICAPLTNAEIQDLVNPTKSSPLILDFRGEAEMNPSLHYHSFAELMKLVAGDREKAQIQVEKAHHLISQLAQEFVGRMQLRPMGWEDLCC